ncbi:MAG: hypothetical protein GXO67_00650 [Archaeoglobi archaeon]|nr:hypothetical protein [Archaeoglobi archaeon]
MIEGVALLVLALVLLSNTFKDYHISKLLSVVVISFLTYVLGHFTSFTTAFTLSTIFVVFYTLFRIGRESFRIDRENEAVFLISFAFFLFLRSLVPDIIGAEKFMDSAFLNAVLNADRFPPPDPYFAGKRLDVYYYFGSVISAVIAKLTLTPPWYAYNIAMAFVGAISISTLHGFLRERGTGAIGLVPLIAGPLYAVYELLNHLSSGSLPGYLFYWNSTRIIPDSTFGNVITEFPYFSFIHGDLHAHVVAISLKILFIAILYRFYRENEYSWAIPVMNFALFATNSWDAPAFFLLSAGLMLLKDRNYWPHVLASALLMLAFKLEMRVSAPVFITMEFSPLSSFLLFWGLLLPPLYYRYRDEIRERPAILLSAIPSLLIPAFLFAPPAIYALRRREFEDSLVIFAAIFILACEFVAIDFRMNTYFKFYLLSWVLLIPAISMAIRDLYRERRRVAIVLIALMLVYPAVATPVRHYKAELTLDGLRFMEESHPGDYDAVRWLYGKNAVIVEGVEGSYTYSGRIASFTGDQAIIAWPNHEVHWRDNGEEIARRMGDVRAIYTSSCETALEIARSYNATYIVYGEYEKSLYGEQNFSCMEKVFESGGTEIYRVD